MFFGIFVFISLLLCLLSVLVQIEFITLYKTVFWDFVLPSFFLLLFTNSKVRSFTISMCLERYVVLVESTFLFFWKWTKNYTSLPRFYLTFKYMHLLVYQDENACMHICIIIIFPLYIYIFFSWGILMLIKK